jgi:hypothetical protein
MARCDSGYFCRVCGRYVDDVTVSALYLRYVLREASFQDLFTAPDSHIWCEPELARFITDPRYRTEVDELRRTEVAEAENAGSAQPLAEEDLATESRDAPLRTEVDSRRTEVEGEGAGTTLSEAERRRREERVTRAWQRLQEIPGSGLTIDEYPLPED